MKLFKFKKLFNERRNLHEIKFFSRIPTSKPLLTDRQRENRLNWCIERKDLSIRKWKSVIWSDESRFTIFKNDGPGRVRELETALQEE